MNGNRFGTIFQVTSWGESHGASLGAIIDGCPSGLALSTEDFREDMALRQGGAASFTTARKEEDLVRIESGVFEGRTTGTPICLRIENKNTVAADYEAFRSVPRPGHADLTTFWKHEHRDHRGGGRSSARETAARVAAGVIARKILAAFGVEVFAFVSRIGEREIPREISLEKSVRDVNPLLMPLALAETRPWLEMVEAQKARADSFGGSISCVVRGLPRGIGEPVFDRLNALLAHALMSLPAAVSCEIGGGRAMSFLPGSEIRDPVRVNASGEVAIDGDRHGGLLGGMSTGNALRLSVDFHAPTSIPAAIESVDLHTKTTSAAEVKGRHDSTPLPRAVPMVEAMVMLTLVDAMMRAGRIPEKL